MIRTTILIVFASAAYFATSFDSIHAQSQSPSTWQAKALPRLQAIYDRGEFRPVSFQASWLPDSTGFTVEELDSQTKTPMLWYYNAETGERRKVETPHGRQAGQDRLSPDGKQQLEFHNGDVFVRNVDSGERTQLTKHDAERDISYHDPSWSPDGQRIVFVESDSTEVRRRSVLVPGDPSYPGVREDVFARVGGKLPALRIGVVDSRGKQIDWLPIEQPEQGFYLHQVEWAGNSGEVLVEIQSRFRDKRQLLLVSTDGAVKRIFDETNEAWAVGSHGINSGLEWIRDGEAFIVVSEKDGWRHAYLCSRDGMRETKLTIGEYDLINRAAIDEEGGWYYFYASPENGTQKYLHRVPLDGSGTLERITPANQPGTHDYDFSPDCKWAVHTYSTVNSPPVV
ncbi:MAG: DPP IV N-terminal domain-containing protein, partial [Planctomycetales bacterium]|nr:DPP IV N-terminal domain-containing protein [Planctomycetales bacterium]